MNDFGIEREHLATHLKMAVPFWMIELSQRDHSYLEKRRQYCAEGIGEKGDVILYGSKKVGRPAEAFNRLAEGLAILMILNKDPFEMFGLRFNPADGSIEV